MRIDLKQIEAGARISIVGETDTAKVRAANLATNREGIMPKTNEMAWHCQECGRKFRTAKAAERAAMGDDGCPGCGGSDIDFSSPPVKTAPMFDAFGHQINPNQCAVDAWKTRNN